MSCWRPRWHSCMPWSPHCHQICLPPMEYRINRSPGLVDPEQLTSNPVLPWHFFSGSGNGRSIWTWSAVGSLALEVGATLVGFRSSTGGEVVGAKFLVELCAPATVSDVFVLAGKAWAPEVLSETTSDLQEPFCQYTTTWQKARMWWLGTNVLLCYCLPTNIGLQSPTWYLLWHLGLDPGLATWAYLMWQRSSSVIFICSSCYRFVTRLGDLGATTSSSSDADESMPSSFCSVSCDAGVEPPLFLFFFAASSFAVIFTTVAPVRCAGLAAAVAAGLLVPPALTSWSSSPSTSTAGEPCFSPNR
jgi:hypothetical protein